MAFSINGIPHNPSELKGYGYRKLITQPLTNNQLSALQDAINTGTDFSMPTYRPYWSVPNYNSGYVYVNTDRFNFTTTLIDSRWFALEQFLNYGYQKFIPTFSGTEPSKERYKVWIITTSEHIYIWDTIRQLWYDLCHNSYVEGSDFYLFGDGTVVEWFVNHGVMYGG